MTPQSALRKTAHEFVQRNAVTALDLAYRGDKLVLLNVGQVKPFVSAAYYNRHPSAFWQRNAFQHDLSIDDGSDGDLHELILRYEVRGRWCYS